MALGRGAVEAVVVTPTFWAGRRVLVTGHTGFKGGWLAHWLRRLDARVAGLALAPPEGPSLFAAAAIGAGLTHVIGDLRDGALVRAVMQDFAPEIVFHLAAQPLVRASFLRPEETYATNVMGTLNVLEAVRATPAVRAVVNITTDKCYENREWLWAYRENDPLGGFDPYSSSKACVEILSASYRQSFFTERVRLATGRAGNVIGGGDWGVDRLVPDVMRAFTAGQPVTLRNPDSVRPWQHVLDALFGYLLLAERLMGPDGQRFAQAYNFGPAVASEVTVGGLVARLMAVWGPDARCIIDRPQDPPHEATLLKLDSTRARTELGWIPRWDIDQALEATAQWYRASAHGGANLRDLMDAQIDAHQAAVGAGRPHA